MLGLHSLGFGVLGVIGSDHEEGMFVPGSGVFNAVQWETSPGGSAIVSFGANAVPVSVDYD
jgi:hypothetical protein